VESTACNHVVPDRGDPTMNTSRWARSGLPLPNVADTGDTWPTVPVRVVRKFLFAGRRTVRSADGPLTLVFTSAGVSAMRIDRSGSSTPGPGRAAQMPRAHVAVKRQSFQVVRRLSGGIPEHDSGGTMVMTRGMTQRPSAFRNVGAQVPGNGLWCRGATVVHRVCATGRRQARPLSIPGGHMGVPLCARPGPDDLPPQRNGSPIGDGSVVGNDHLHGHGNLGPQCKLALGSPTESVLVESTHRLDQPAFHRHGAAHDHGIPKHGIRRHCCTNTVSRPDELESTTSHRPATRGGAGRLVTATTSRAVG